MAFGAAFINLPKVLNARLNEKRKSNQEKNAEQVAIETSTNDVDLRSNPKLVNKWKIKEH